MKRFLFTALLAASPAFAQPGAEVAPVEAAPETAPTAETALPVEPTVESVDNDIDLGALGLDPATAVFDDKLQIYGFVDFSWTTQRFETKAIPPADAFSVGSVNLYLRKNLSPRWRTLTEVRFLFAPNGSLDETGQGYQITAVSDQANFERPITWGGISIERAHAEYDLARWLTVRAGHFLTPYGIWNTDHGSPTIIGTFRPYIVGEQFFPEHQTGIELFGKKSFDEYSLEYHATVSNGRSPFEATRDLDRRPALGGRLVLATPWLGSMQLGASAYRGLAWEGSSAASSSQYEEVALGADVSWDHGALHVQGEVLFQQRRYRAGARAARGIGFAPDGEASGAYALLGYRFSTLWDVMPFAIYEIYRPYDVTIVGQAVTGLNAGLNFRPIPTLVLKAQGALVKFGDKGLLGGSGKVLSLQAAWVF